MVSRASGTASFQAVYPARKRWAIRAMPLWGGLWSYTRKDQPSQFCPTLLVLAHWENNRHRVVTDKVDSDAGLGFGGLAVGLGRTIAPMAHGIDCGAG